MYLSSESGLAGAISVNDRAFCFQSRSISSVNLFLFKVICVFCTLSSSRSLVSGLVRNCQRGATSRHPRTDLPHVYCGLPRCQHLLRKPSSPPCQGEFPGKGSTKHLLLFFFFLASPKARLSPAAQGITVMLHHVRSPCGPMGAGELWPPQKHPSMEWERAELSMLGRRRRISAGPHPKAHPSQFVCSCGLEQTGTLSLSSWQNETEHLVLFCSSADGSLK